MLRYICKCTAWDLKGALSENHHQQNKLTHILIFLEPTQLLLEHWLPCECFFLILIAAQVGFQMGPVHLMVQLQRAINWS